ncbi:MAG: Xylose isomerase domain protein barrel [Armatimonadetes bacterium]|nr:Xylose isomerase domain protein barrel [Armatimonadota bacterium]
MGELRVGVMERVLRQPRAELFRTAAELGFDGVEIEVGGDLELLRAAQRQRPDSVCSLICGGEGMGAADAEARSAARARLTQAIGDATVLGVRGILWPMFDPEVTAGSLAARRFVDDLRACLFDAEYAGVVVAWENALDSTETRAIIEQVGSDYFRSYFDFANSAKRGADPAAEIRDLFDLIYQVHAKNLNKLPLDAPGVDLKACLCELKGRGYAGWVVLETGPGDDPIAAARHNQQVVRDVWAEA